MKDHNRNNLQSRGLRRGLTCLAIAALALTAPSSHAANRFWSGAGTWNTSTANWGTVTGGPYNTFTWVNANNDTGVFEGTAGTVSLGTGITVGGLEFDTVSYLLTANTLTFGVSGNILANQNATINSAIAATTGLTITKTGSGTLTLGGTNTYAASTTVSVGTLKAGSTTALSTNSVFSVAAGATLDLGGYTNTIKSLSTATGTITDSSAAGSGGTLKITTFAATAQLFTGSLALQWNGPQGASTMLTAAGNTFSGGATVGGAASVNNRFLLGNTTIGSGTPGALTSGVWGTGPLTLGVTAADWAQILFTGAATINNALVVNSPLGNSDAAGTFRVDSLGNVFAGTLNANLGNATFRNNGGNGSVSLNNTIFGNSGLMLSASAGTSLTITLANPGTANSYAGDTTISSVKETLTLGAADQIPNGTGKGNLINNGTFKMGGFSETINGLSGSGIVDGVSGSPTLTVGDGNATGAFSGAINNTSGTLSLVKIGTGTQTLAGVNTYGGSTTINGGKLQGVVGGSSANSTVILNATTATNSVSITDNTKGWTNAALTVSAAGVLDFNFGAVTPSTTVSPLNITGLAAFTATPNVSVEISLSLLPGTYPLMTWGSTSGTAPTTANLIATLPVGAAGSLSVSGNTLNLVIVSTVNYWDNNGATAGFGTAAGTWASPTTGNSSQGWSTDGTGSTLPANFTTTATNAVSFGNGATGLGAGAITVSGSVTNGAMTFASGSGAITLSGGTIYFPAVGGITVNNTSNTVSSALAGANTSLTKAGTGILTLSGANTYTGATTVGAGTLNLTGQGTGSSISVNNGGVFNEAASGVITGSGVTFTQNSSGNTSTLAGTNTYTGATTISAGTLKAGSTTGLSSNSAFSVAAGATLDLGGYNNTIKSLGADTATSTITDSSPAGSGGTLTISTALGGTACAQLFTGSLGLQIFGGGNTTILGNPNSTYSGGTIFGAGGTSGTRFLGSGTVGTGSPGAVTKGYFGTGTITMGAAPTDRTQLYISGNTTINNAIVVNSMLGDGSSFGTFRVEPGPLNIPANNTINANLSDVMFQAQNGLGRTVFVSGTISGLSGLRVLAQGSGGITVTLNNTGTANSYAGNTTISSPNVSSPTAILTLGAAEQIPNGAGTGNLVMTNGAFNLGGFNETINGLSGSGIVDGVSGTPTLTVGDNNTNGSFSGKINNTAGTLSLVKIGTGTQTLAGNNNYSGSTTINGGILQGVVGGSCSNSTVILNNATATNSVSITNNTNTWTCANLTVSTAGDLDFNFGATLPSMSVSPLTITGLADFTAATPSISVEGSLPPGTYPLMTWGSTTGNDPSTGNLTLTMAAGTSANLSVSGNTLYLVINSVPTGSSSTSAYSINTTNDLLIGPALTSISDAIVPNVGENNANSHGNTLTLTDGSFGDAGANGGYCIASGMVTYNLNTNVNPAGYTITNITTYSGWANPGRANQRYTVSFLRVGSSTFEDQIVVAYNYSGGNPSDTMVTTGVNETNVAAILFDFSTPQQNGGVGYKELQAFGYGAVQFGVPTQYYWDSNGTNAGFGAAGGTWASPTTGNATQGWSTDGTGSTLPIGSIFTDAYSFLNLGNGATGLGAGTITVSGSVTNGGMTFASGSGNIVLSGGTINFPPGGTSTITVNNTSNSLSSVVAGASSSLLKAGASTGTLTLSGANTYTGNTTVSGGTLNVNNANALGAGNVSVLAGTTLQIQGGITLTNPLSIAGGGVSHPVAYGSILTYGANTLTGPVTLLGSRLATADNNILTFTGGVTNGSAASQTIVGAFAFNNRPLDNGNNPVFLAGDGAIPPPVTGKTIYLNTAGNNWSSATLFFAAIVQLGVDNAMPTNAPVILGYSYPGTASSTLNLNGHNQTVGTIETYAGVAANEGPNISITGGGTLTVNLQTSKTFIGVISDGTTPTALTLNGPGTLNLTGANTYSGATTVANGTLQLSSPSALSASTSVYLFTAGGNLDLAFTGTNQVAALYIDGVRQPNGVYDANTSPITDSGYLLVLPTPSFSGISVSGTTLTLKAKNGTPNGPWTLLSSTNVALPLIQWRTNSTGTYDGSGNLNTNLLNTATNRQQFFRLK